ncbi:hypothetical protein L228DRAFT_107170 [Xylona heveae TC161]|uniref:Uncharacterized protein n=1 Tax=Xylona heveae (strain CBS 132557 / TC161) TaxID=1328760 RepID=A0A165HBK4_XYLHT|nr:hypothetical protein L228DRAFT_107170 [Xylona heveae TC161]KZF23260.1 hypothetical protein L228DRAFT_107170 [Xylona heveae TC161]
MESRIKRLFRSKSKKHKQEQGQKTQPQTLRSHHGRTDGAARADPLLRTSAYESLPARGEPLTGAYPLRGNGEGSAPILNGRQRALRQTHNGLGNPHRATKSDVAVPPLPPDMEDALKHHRQSASTGNLSNTMHRNGVPGMAFTTDKPEPLTNHGISRDVLTTASGNGDGQSRRRKPPPRQHVDLLLAAGLPHEYSAKAPPAPRNGNYNEAIADRNIENTSTAMPDHSKILNGDGHRVSSERKLPEETSKPLAAGQGAPVNSELASSLIERARNGESPPPRQSSRNQAELREKVDGDRSVRERPYSGVILSATPPGTRNVSSNQNDMLNKSLPPVPTTERENASVVSKNEPRATEKAEPSNTTSEVTRKPFPVQDGSKLPSLEGIVDLSNTVDTTVSERVAPGISSPQCLCFGYLAQSQQLSPMKP